MSRRCPRCGKPALRIPRRALDRLISLIRPVQRYQCTALECAWQGNLPRERALEGRRFSPLTTPTYTPPTGDD